MRIQNQSKLHFGAQLLTPKGVPLRFVKDCVTEVVPALVWRVEDSDKENLLKVLESWVKSGQSDFASALTNVLKGNQPCLANLVPSNLIYRKQWLLLLKTLSTFLTSQIIHPGASIASGALKAFSVQRFQLKQALKNNNIFIMTIEGKVIGITQIGSTYDAHKIAFMETAYWNRRIPGHKGARFYGVLEGIMSEAIKYLTPKPMEWDPANRRVRAYFDHIVVRLCRKKPKRTWAIETKQIDKATVQKLVDAMELRYHTKSMLIQPSERAQQFLSKIEDPDFLVPR